MKSYLLSLLFVFTFLGIHAQGNYMFFNLFLDKGLSDARITAIVQDKLGFMWFGTPNGLNRYDGYTIKTFYAGPQCGLPSNYIRVLFSNRKGELLVGTDKGMASYDFSTETFQRTNDKGLPAAAAVYCFTEDYKGNIYTGTSKGLFRRDRKVNNWKDISAAFNLSGRLTLVRGLLFMEDNVLYASTQKKNFYKLNFATQQVDSFSFKVGTINECCLYMFGMQKLNDTEILVGTLSYGLIKFNTRTGLFSQTKGVLRKQDSILFNSVTQIIRDHTGRFWVTSNYFRLAEYLPSADSVVTYKESIYNPYGFVGGSASCVYEDRQHNIWIGTSLSGVYHFNPNRNRTLFYHGNNFTKGALQQGKVISIASLDSNTLMIGTNSGPSIYKHHTNTFLNFKGYAYNFGHNALEQVMAGLQDRHGIIWMGSIRLGLMRYDPYSHKMDVYGRFTKPIPFEDDGITDMLELKGYSLLVIGYGRPAVFHTRTYTSHSFRNDRVHPLYQLDNVADLSYDIKHKNIWLALADGKLYEYDPDKDVLIERSTLINSNPKPMAIYKIAFDPTGRLWCATNIGALCLEVNKPAKIYSLNTDKKGSAEVKNILPVGTDIWLTNDRSIARLNTLSGNMVQLGERDGLNGVQLLGNSLTLSPWNTILIGANSGFYEIFPDKVMEEPTTSSAFLTGFRIYDKPFTSHLAISMVKEMKLSYKQNFFSFDISAFDYSEANDMEYAYKLEGFDKDWIYIGKQRSGSYTNVPGGSYTLLLKVRNNSGIWNEGGQRIHIHIDKPFWVKWWFYAIVFSCLTGMIFLIYTSRIRNIRKQARLRSDYDIKLNELENSALRTQMNPHFIFNSLNTINSFINTNEPAKANQYISKFSRLIRLILDHSREKKITLSNELEVVELYIVLERIRFENKFTYTITVDEGIGADNMEIPPLIVQPFVENAILHGLLPLAEGGILKITVSKKENHLLLIVEDNGVGRQKAKGLKLPSNEKHKSHGIGITLKRITLFNKEHQFNGTVTITDVVDAQNNVAGTRVEIPLAWEECY